MMGNYLLLHLDLVDNAIFVFTQLASLIRGVVIQMRECLPGRPLVMTGPIALSALCPPQVVTVIMIVVLDALVDGWRLVVHDAAVSHDALVGNRGVLLLPLDDLRRVVVAAIRKQTLRVRQRGRGLLPILNKSVGTLLLRLLELLLVLQVRVHVVVRHAAPAVGCGQSGRGGWPTGAIAS